MAQLLTRVVLKYIEEMSYYAQVTMPCQRHENFYLIQ